MGYSFNAYTDIYTYTYTLSHTHMHSQTHRWMFCCLQHFCANEINWLDALSTSLSGPLSHFVKVLSKSKNHFFLFLIVVVAIDLSYTLYCCLLFSLPCEEQNEKHSKSITNRIKMVVQTTCG